MDREYGDGSDCEICLRCGFCITCGDCKEYGCGKEIKKTVETIEG